MTDPTKDAERLARIRVLTEADDGSRNFTAGTMLFVLHYFDATIARLTEDLRQTADAVRQEKEEVSRLTQERDEARRSAEVMKATLTKIASLEVSGGAAANLAGRTLGWPSPWVAEDAQPTTDDVERAREPGLTPRLRALSITNQHASLFTSVGAREQVAESIEKHITAARREEPGR